MLARADATGTRRELVAAGAALALAGLAGCGSDDGTAADHADDRGFDATGARGERVRLDAVPQRIISDAASASALLALGIRPVGVWSAGPLAQTQALEGQDVAGIESLGEVFGEVRIEKAISLRPDLVVTGYYPLEKQLGGINPGDAKTADALEQAAPILTVEATTAATRYIDAFAALGAKLGADLDAPEVADARADFDAARRAFEAAVEAKPGLTVSAVSTGETLFLANPTDFAEFIDLTRWGLDMPRPDGVEDRGYFAEVSWERFAEVDGDVVFLDTRSGPLEEVVSGLEAKQPTWSRIPAVRAGAIAPWVTDTFTNHAAYARHLRAFTAAIERAEPRRA